MPGLLDFLFGKKPLEQSAKTGSPTVTSQTPPANPAYSQDTMRAMAEEAARRAQDQAAAEKKAAKAKDAGQ